MKNEIIAGLGILAIFLFIQNKGSPGLSKPVAIIDKIQENQIKIDPKPLVNFPLITRQLEFLESQKQEAQQYSENQINIAQRNFSIITKEPAISNRAKVLRNVDYNNTLQEVLGNIRSNLSNFTTKINRKITELEQIV
jgi:hypothetical protein